MEFPSSDACLEDLAVDDGTRDKENSNKAIRLDSYIHRHFPFFSLDCRF